MKSLAVLMTCHNRVDSTMDCLAHLFAQSACDGVALSVYLVDDGSSDGTSQVVGERYPAVNVIIGDGSLFWNRGMHRAFEEALETGYDYYLWLNDDTNLYSEALDTLLRSHAELEQKGTPPSIVVVSTRDPETGEFTYGGMKNRRGVLNRIGHRFVPPADHLQQCDAMCGNCVLIPKGVTERVGNIDPQYAHQWGDVDYGMRATEKGCQLWIAPGYLAECGGNPDAVKWKAPGLPFKERLAAFRSVKGLGTDDWLRFVRRHAGVLWPLVWLSPYVRFVLATFR